MSEVKYIGITIGPICDTLADADSPAALWFASSCFSDVTRRLCAAITGPKGIEGAVILSPYYSDAIPLDDGVGKFHDRIIFSTEHYDRKKLEAIIAEVRREMAEDFMYPGQKMEKKDIADFLSVYLQIHFVVLDGDHVKENSILAVSPYLDAMELMKTFPADNTGNPFRAIFTGSQDSSNVYLRKSPLFKAVADNNNQFISRKGPIRTIQEIAACDGFLAGDLKKHHYFAVVQADGDGMGTFLKGLDDKNVTLFSKSCLEYAREAAAKIGGFGGMTIYAGGDDLLFLAPVENAADKNVFALCQEISHLFQDKMKAVFPDNPQIPTVSFGISIQYEKFPLYEALENARQLLFGEAKTHCYKGMNHAGKNSMAIELQKHSGQTVGLVVSNDSFHVLEEVMALGNSLSDGENAVNSVLYTIQTYQFLLHVLNREVQEGRVDKDAYKEAWMNLFDNVDQKPAESYLNSVCDVWYDYILKGSDKIEAMDGRHFVDLPEKAEEKNMAVMIYLLRLKKFFVERGED